MAGEVKSTCRNQAVCRASTLLGRLPASNMPPNMTRREGARYTYQAPPSGTEV